MGLRPAIAVLALAALPSHAHGARSLAEVYAQMTPPVTEAEWHLHDPSRILHDGDRQLVAVTGKAQEDGYGCGLEVWERAGAAAPWMPHLCLFEDKPAWIAEELPTNDGAFWAPDFTPDGDLVYSVSAGFEERGSCVGLARRAEGDWVDIGAPINCVFDPSDVEVETIDPAVFRTGGQDYLIAGGGRIFAAPLTGGAPDDWYEEGADGWHVLAARPGMDDRWVEAAQMLEAGGATWLFVNWGACCRGLASTYEIRVGRAEGPLGPFFDRDGRALREGGGALFLAAQADQIGPGHAGFRRENGQLFMSYHFYDAERDGLPWIGEAALDFSTGWPRRDARRPGMRPAAPKRRKQSGKTTPAQARA
ncbi:MAG: family 43 glycosylhydrolase [Pseudomonadota bacterium]